MSWRDDNYNAMIGTKPLFGTSEGNLVFENDALRLRIKHLGKNYERVIEMKDEKISNLQEKCEHLQYQVDEARRKIDQLNQKKASLKKQKEDILAKMDEFRRKHCTDSDRIKSLEADLQNISAENEMLTKNELEQNVEKAFLEKEFELLHTKLSLQDEKLAKRDEEFKEMMKKGQEENQALLAQFQKMSDQFKGQIEAISHIAQTMSAATVTQNTPESSDEGSNENNALLRTTDYPNVSKPTRPTNALKPLRKTVTPRTTDKTVTPRKPDRLDPKIKCTTNNMSFRDIPAVQINFDSSGGKLEFPK